MIGPVKEICNIHHINKYRIPGGTVICEKCEEKSRKELKKGQNAMASAANSAAWKDKKVDLAHKQMDLPSRLLTYRFSSFVAEDVVRQRVVQACKTFAHRCPNVGGGMMLLGKKGTGKTHLATSICQRLCDRGVTARIDTANAIIRNIKVGWGVQSKDKNKQKFFNMYTSVGLLVVDDVGVQHGTDTEKIIMNDIVNIRYERNIPTIVIGNILQSDVKKILGERVVDRIMHSGKILQFNWESWRTKK